MRTPNPVRRTALFSLADARGNNPHGTRETSFDEGRRLNRGRYETVGDMDRALDVRARPRQLAPRLGEGPSEAQGPPPGGLLGILALVAVGAGIAYVLMKKDGGEDDEDEVAALPHPAPAPAPSVVSHPITNPTPVVVVQAAPNPAPVEPPKRRRRAKAEAPKVETTTVTTVV